MANRTSGAGRTERREAAQPLGNREQPPLVMDMIFRDEECRIRTEHAPANFTTLKHMAHNLIRKAPGKPSFRAKRKIAAWDDDFPQVSLPHDFFTRFPCKALSGVAHFRSIPPGCRPP
jgi:hypothetical protein